MDVGRVTHAERNQQAEKHPHGDNPKYEGSKMEYDAQVHRLLSNGESHRCKPIEMGPP